MMEKFKTIYSSKYKRVVVNTETGQKKEIILDQKERQAIAQGVHLQPHGKDEREFFDKYRHLKKKTDGVIVNINEEKRMLVEKNEDYEKALREEFDTRHK